MSLLRELGLIETFGPANEAQVFPRRSVEVERRLLRQVAQQAFGLRGVLENVEAVYLHLAGGGGEAAGHDVHGRGLPGAVGAEEAVDLPVPDGEAQIGDGGVCAVALGQMTDFNQGRYPLTLQM